MTLSKMIDLIAEVAAKRATQEGGSKEETPNALSLIIATILAAFWRRGSRFIQIGFVFHKHVLQPLLQGDLK